MSGEQLVQGLLPVRNLRQTQPTLFCCSENMSTLAGLQTLVSNTKNPTSLTDVELFTMTLPLCCKPSSVLIPLSNHAQLEICVLAAILSLTAVVNYLLVQ